VESLTPAGPTSRTCTNEYKALPSHARRCVADGGAGTGSGVGVGDREAPKVGEARDGTATVDLATPVDKNLAGSVSLASASVNRSSSLPLSIAVPPPSFIGSKPPSIERRERSIRVGEARGSPIMSAHSAVCTRTPPLKSDPANKVPSARAWRLWRKAAACAGTRRKTVPSSDRADTARWARAEKEAKENGAQTELGWVAFAFS
jgi:hypothetical protein